VFEVIVMADFILMPKVDPTQEFIEISQDFLKHQGYIMWNLKTI
jgi:hypothetical protein